MVKNDPNKITAMLKVVVTGEFYDDEASGETLRYCVEQDLEDTGFEVDVSILKDQEAVAPFYEEGEDFLNYFMKHTMGRCGRCKAPLPALEGMRSKFCWMCGRQVKWE